MTKFKQTNEEKLKQRPLDNNEISERVSRGQFDGLSEIYERLNKANSVSTGGGSKPKISRENPLSARQSTF